MDTNVEDMVALVIDEGHSRFGQIAKILYHDWREYGDIGVEFLDGHSEEFYDGLMKGDSPSKINTYYRLADEKGVDFDKTGEGPRSLKKKFLKLGKGNLKDLREQYMALFNVNLN